MRKRKMKRMGLILCFLLFFVISSGRVGVCSLKQEEKLLEEKLTSPIKQPGISFLGEKLIYTVKWSGLPLFSLGKLILEVGTKQNQISGQPTYLFSWELRIVDTLFHEKRENLVDVDTFYLYRVTISREEWGNPPKSWIVEIDQKAELALINDEKNGEEEIRLPFFPVFDIPSLIYWLRAQKLEVEEEFSFFLLEDDSPEACKEKIGEQVQVKILKKEEVAIHNEIYSTFLCEEVGSGKIKVWFSVDERHLPVKIKVDVGEGAFIAFLDKGKSILSSNKI